MGPFGGENYLLNGIYFWRLSVIALNLDFTSAGNFKWSLSREVLTCECKAFPRHMATVFRFPKNTSSLPREAACILRLCSISLGLHIALHRCRWHRSAGGGFPVRQFCRGPELGWCRRICSCSFGGRCRWLFCSGLTG